MILTVKLAEVYNRNSNVSTVKSPPFSSWAELERFSTSNCIFCWFSPCILLYCNGFALFHVILFNICHIFLFDFNFKPDFDVFPPTVFAKMTKSRIRSRHALVTWHPLINTVDLPMTVRRSFGALPCKWSATEPIHVSLSKIGF